MLPPMLSHPEARWSAALTLAALLCGAWALWPVAFPAARAPTVSHAALPALRTDSTAATQTQATQTQAAPVYPQTSSITPLISGKLNLNTATEAQLEALPKVGPALAKRLIEGRPYRSLADLDAVKGIGPSLMQALTPLVSF